MTRRTVTAALYLLLVPLVLMTALAQQGADIEGVEVGIMNGTVGLNGDLILFLGDGSDDAVRVESGVGDDIVLSVDGGTDAVSISGTQSAAGVPGIVSLDHQSRARWTLATAQVVPPATWTPISFDSVQFDEHAECVAGIPAPPFPGTPWSFGATVEGYYQVNARAEFEYEGLGDLFVTIAIFVNGSVYAQGNILQPTSETGLVYSYNRGPNVSDVVHLQAGDTLEIYVYNETAPARSLAVGVGEKTYVSVHKLS